MGEGRNVYRVLVGKPERKRPLERPWRRWEDGIKMDLREIGWGSVKWIHLAQDRDRWGGCCECGDEPSGSGATELVIRSLVLQHMFTACPAGSLLIIWKDAHISCETLNDFCSKAIGSIFIIQLTVLKSTTYYSCIPADVEAQ
jgi:hypothetical protein